MFGARDEHHQDERHVGQRARPRQPDECADRQRGRAAQRDIDARIQHGQPHAGPDRIARIGAGEPAVDLGAEAEPEDLRRDDRHRERDPIDGYRIEAERARDDDRQHEFQAERADP